MRPEPCPAPAPLAPIARQRFPELRELPVQLQLGSYRAEMLYWGFIDQPGWRNYLHVHSHYEICYAFSGRGLFRMQGHELNVRGGDVFIARPSEEHEILSSPETLCIYFWSYTLLKQTTKGKGPPTDSQLCAIDRLLGAFVQSQVWVSARVPGMERTLELLTEEIARREPGFVGNIQALSAKLILDTARACVGTLPGERPPQPSESPSRAAVQQAQAYMEDNLCRIQSVHEIAAQVNLSERHFSRLFARQTGSSPLQALTRLRLERAAQLLMDRSLPVKAIAQQVGFSDVRYFTTVFGRHFKLPPATFREKGGTRWPNPSRKGR